MQVGHSSMLPRVSLDSPPSSHDTTYCSLVKHLLDVGTAAATRIGIVARCWSQHGGIAGQLLCQLHRHRTQHGPRPCTRLAHLEEMAHLQSNGSQALADLEGERGQVQVQGQHWHVGTVAMPAHRYLLFWPAPPGQLINARTCAQAPSSSDLSVACTTGHAMTHLTPTRIRRCSLLARTVSFLSMTPLNTLLPIPASASSRKARLGCDLSASAPSTRAGTCMRALMHPSNHSLTLSYIHWRLPGWYSSSRRAML